MLFSVLQAHVIIHNITDPKNPNISKRQLALDTYMMMLCSAQHEYGDKPDPVADALAEGESRSPMPIINFVRTGLKAATYSVGPSVALCSEANCMDCLVNWRQTMDARVCQGFSGPDFFTAKQCPPGLGCNRQVGQHITSPAAHQCIFSQRTPTPHPAPWICRSICSIQNAPADSLCGNKIRLWCKKSVHVHMRVPALTQTHTPYTIVL